MDEAASQARLSSHTRLPSCSGWSSGRSRRGVSSPRPSASRILKRRPCSGMRRGTSARSWRRGKSAGGRAIPRKLWRRATSGRCCPSGPGCR
ncbi:MAG: hypothetical protein ACLR1K_00130 [Oscillospiraceae bacterium]